MYRVILGRGDIAFQTRKNISIADNFRLSELACKSEDSDVQVVMLNYLLVDKLQELRNRINYYQKQKNLKEIPIFITSGYRTKEHNKRVGGAERSLHLSGLAVDIQVDYDFERVIKLAKEIGFTGIGRYRNHLHLDLGEKRYWESR